MAGAQYSVPLISAFMLHHRGLKLLGIAILSTEDSSALSTPQLPLILLTLVSVSHNWNVLEKTRGGHSSRVELVSVTMTSG